MQARYDYCPALPAPARAARCTAATEPPRPAEWPQDDGEAFELLSQRLSDEPARECVRRAQLVDLRRQSREPYFADEAKLADDLTRMVDALQAMRRDDPRRGECAAATAPRANAAAWELRERALSAPRPDVAASTATMARAANLFTDLLASFEPDELRALGVCEPVFDIALARADLLQQLHEWNACAAAFDYAVSLGSAGESLEQASYGAVLCHQRRYARIDAQVRELRPMLRMEAQLIHTDDWRSLLGAFHRYLCIAGDEALTDPYAEVAFARADVFLQGGALWEAVVGFRAVAYEHGGSPVGFEALGRYAELIDAMGAGQVCAPQLRDDLVALLGSYCAETDPSGDCRVLRQRLMRLQGFRN
jgi:hypothetical protein